MTDDHEHNWQIWPETDGQEQRCSICGAYRKTPVEPKPQGPRMDYLIENPDGDHVLHLFAVGGMIHIHTNDRTLPLSEPMARQIVNGLRALLSGQFSRAVTETYLRLEAERAARSSQSDGASMPSAPNLKPELDML